jgi:hypothetical protein
VRLLGYEALAVFGDCFDEVTLLDPVRFPGAVLLLLLFFCCCCCCFCCCRCVCVPVSVAEHVRALEEVTLLDPARFPGAAPLPP